MDTRSPLACLALLLLPAIVSAEPLFTGVDVFTAGTQGYHTFRIPAIVTAPDGSLIAFAEGRKENSHDPGGGDIDLVAKRSSDQGATWSSLVVLDDPGEGWSASNPTPVTDRDTGRVWILYNRWEPAFGTERSQPGTSNNQTWARYSEDNGKTWSDARDLTRAARDYDHWGAMFLGPGGRHSDTRRTPRHPVGHEARCLLCVRRRGRLQRPHPNHALLRDV